jgi:hypothetical protein
MATISRSRGLTQLVSLESTVLRFDRSVDRLDRLDLDRGFFLPESVFLGLWVDFCEGNLGCCCSRDLDSDLFLSLDLFRSMGCCSSWRGLWFGDFFLAIFVAALASRKSSFFLHRIVIWAWRHRFWGRPKSFLPGF